ncbi:tRNA (adenosine(37)-N6)-threonylcarbamoyltransferase complex ATPase subunit type 1 TsaE [Candidatus Peregrinibacteria bacterium]|nr:tRNA (adenosine(37)-N6)-threonylcarbamoyltransferase complex ATPase subunit type 1 TsaE [Candidatus Peregrinibacteria bacterium]
MNDLISIRLSSAEKTAFCGNSLAATLYQFPLTILCTGALGAGKTTCIQGLAQGLGIEDPVTSPTFALEQRYRARDGTPFTHLDLYRLSQRDAVSQVHATDDHAGIRCIEWSDRLPEGAIAEPCMTIGFHEEGAERTVQISFDPLPLPDAQQVVQWRKDAALQPHIVAHCEAVAAAAVQLGQACIDAGKPCRLTFLQRAGELHDLFRFIDFHTASGPPQVRETSQERGVWEVWKKRFAGLRHEAACAQFLRDEGFAALADAVAVHGLHLPSPERRTVEQKILFYADKRVRGDEMVTLEERFSDFRARYTNGNRTPENDRWFAEAKRIEEELFPEGVPI